MDDTPPRRSRRPNDKRKDATFPLIPFLIGVVVLGFVIGAGLSMAGHRGQKVASLPVATLQPTAVPVATLAPLATPRPTSLATDTPEPTASALGSTAPVANASAKPSAKPTTAHVALASLPPSSAPSAGATHTPVSTATSVAATASPAPVRTHAAPEAVKTAIPVSAKTAAPVVTAIASAPATAAATAAPAAAAIDADSDFGRLSASVVKQYLRALARGDTESAAGAFAPGSSNSYPERAILDSSAQIGTISARGSNDVQTVNATITTPGGTYLGTYAVRRSSTGAAIIVSHSLNKG